MTVDFIASESNVLVNNYTHVYMSFSCIILTLVVMVLAHIQASPLHNRPHRLSLSRTKRFSEPQPRDEIVLRDTIEINAENYETRVDQLAEKIKQMFRDSAASEHRQPAAMNQGGVFRNRQALDGPISVMLETYVISQQARASAELAENAERRDHHTRLQTTMLAAGR